MRKALVLFAGIGGSSLGLKKAGYSTFSIEIESKLADIHKKNIGECQIADILEVKPIYVKYGIDIPEIFWLSPPCQAYSKASIGKGKGISKSREDKDILIQLIRDKWFEVLPSPYIVLENVPEYRKSESFKVWCEYLKEMEYNVRYGVLDAYDFGVPTKRLRLIAIASAKSVSIPLIQCPYLNVGWFNAIGELVLGMNDSELTPAQTTWLESRDAIPQPFLLERIGYYKGNPKFALPNEPIWTIKKSIGTDGKGANRSKFINVVTRGGVKDLSVQGLGMLQGFPSDYYWGDKDGISVGGIGNSVCPPLALAIGNSINGVLT